MVRGRTEATDHRCADSGVESGSGENLLEQLRRHSAGAGESREQSSRSQQLEREEVRVLIRARGLLGVSRRRRELRRVEHDEIECRSRVAEPAKLREDVGVAPVDAGGIESVRSDVLAGERQRRGGAVDGEDRARAAGKRSTGEATAVAEAVEDIASSGERSNATSVRALVEIEAAFLPLSDVDAVAESAFEDREL